MSESNLACLVKHVRFQPGTPGAGREGQQVRLVCVPRFCDTGTLVLVNLATLRVHPITFDAGMGGA